MTKSYRVSIVGLFLLLLFTCVLSLKYGQMDISLRDILHSITCYDGSITSDVIINLRLPRVLFAALAGCGLALAGYVMQASVQNPLADPYILGISSGASLGAAFALFLGSSLPFIQSELTVSFSAFVGALLAIVLVHLTANYRGRTTSVRLVLAGVIVNTLCTSIINLLIFSAKDIEAIRSVTFWTMGSLADISWTQVAGFGIVLFLIIGYFMTQLRPLNLISLGDETASTLGINSHKKRKHYILVVTLLTGIMVAQCGIIGFVGLIIPHAVRGICKTSSSQILPLVLISGSIFLVIVDLLSRIILENQEIPIGIITSIIGTPIFLFIFIKQGYGA